MQRTSSNVKFDIGTIWELFCIIYISGMARSFKGQKNCIKDTTMPVRALSPILCPIIFGLEDVEALSISGN